MPRTDGIDITRAKACPPRLNCASASETVLSRKHLGSSPGVASWAGRLRPSSPTCGRRKSADTWAAPWEVAVVSPPPRASRKAAARVAPDSYLHMSQAPYKPSPWCRRPHTSPWAHEDPAVSREEIEAAPDLGTTLRATHADVGSVLHLKLATSPRCVEQPHDLKAVQVGQLVLTSARVLSRHMGLMRGCAGFSFRCRT